MARKRQGYLPLLIDGRQRLSGLLVVRADSPIRDIRELDGQELAFPAPNAFAASLLLRAHLAEQGIRPRPQYLTSHANIYRAVVMGAVVAGGGVNNTFQREEPALRGRLRVLYETPGYAPHPLLAHARVPAKVRESLLAQLLALAHAETGQKLLEAVQMPQPVRADYPRDFAPLESLGLDKFAVLDAA
jgi:phosphonate transport system substrate-binding protein